MQSVAELNQLSLRAFKPLFASLALGALTAPRGDFDATFIGPGWLRRLAGPGLALGGLAHWQGKRFDGQGGGLNLVQRAGELLGIMPIAIEQGPSRVDGRPALKVVYPPTTRFPWPYIVDELRALDHDRLLGLTYVNRSGLSGLAVPFLLTRARSNR